MNQSKSLKSFDTFINIHFILSWKTNIRLEKSSRGISFLLFFISLRLQLISWFDAHNLNFNFTCEKFTLIEDLKAIQCALNQLKYNFILNYIFIFLALEAHYMMKKIVSNWKYVRCGMVSTRNKSLMEQKWMNKRIYRAQYFTFSRREFFCDLLIPLSIRLWCLAFSFYFPS